MKRPYDFQLDAVRKIQGAPGVILADACGLGKTVTAIEAAKAIRRETFKGLVVCPPSLIGQWCESLRDQDPSVEAFAPNYIPYDFSEYEGWIVVSYYELFDRHLFRQLEEVVWDVVIADEAHRLRNKNTKAAKAIKQLEYARALALTATPMEHGAQELWSILNFVRPDKFPTYWSYIIEHFEVEEGAFTKWDIQGLKDPVAFGKLIEPYMLQRTKEDVMPELPEKIIIDQYVPLLDKQQKIYSDIKNADDIVVEVENKELLILNVLSLLTKLQQVSSMPQILGFEVPSAKLQWLSEFIDDHPDEPIAVFSRFRAVAETIAFRYSGAFVGGGLSEAFLFAQGKTNLVSCVIADSLQGVDGMQRADHAVFIDSHWSSTQMTQAIDRIHRMNVKSAKNIYLLHSTKEDKMILEALEKKWTEQELVYYFIQNLRA